MLMKSKVFLLFSAFLVSLLAISCQNDNPAEQLDDADLVSFSESEVTQGVIRIKFEKEPGEIIEQNLASAGTRAFAGLPELEALSENINIIEMTRTFPHAGKFEPRTRERGMHLWYDVYFEETVSVTRAKTDFDKVSGVAIVEPIERISRIPYTVTPLTEEETEQIIAQKENSRYGIPVNDPRFKDQWHYANDGSMARAKTGADINLINAWRKQTGHPDVIVAIVDGGLDIDHVDLEDNVWVNVAELNGSAGVDDDNNGYKDDKYGWNFYNNNATIVADDHGTHVGGTVSAVNNNGIGVSGIAGGNGVQGSGVKIMSCQIFIPTSQYATSRIPQAIKYGADNGAVISQNSWGGGSFSDATREAIDYFIAYAGLDENGVQVGPMKGGVVIFASGNDNSGSLSYPGAYDKVVAVNSMAPDYKRAYYSNYGTWTNITAPGGAADYGTVYEVLSTDINNRYAYMQGTSMACPHVSGIAALMVSEYGTKGKGYTNEQLKARLLSSVHDINQYNPSYSGRMGTGYVDAAKTLYDDMGIPPLKITDLVSTWESTKCDLTWSLTADPDLYAAWEYIVYLDTNPITVSNISSAPIKGRVRVSPFLNIGEQIKYSITGLQASANYYIAVVGIDLYGNRSEPAFTERDSTPNTPPQIIMDPHVDNIVLKNSESGIYYFTVVDAEGHSWTVDSVNSTPGAIITRKADNSGFQVSITGFNVPIDIYTLQIRVTDQRNAFSDYNLTYEIVADNPPQITMDPKIDNIVLKSSETGTYHFKVTEPEGLSWTVALVNGSYATGVEKDSDNNGFNVHIDARLASAGKYVLGIKVTNEVGVSANYDLPYEILANTPPSVVKPFEDVNFLKLNESISFNLNDYFTDADNDPITYEVSLGASQIVSATITGSNMTLVSQNPGEVRITVTAKDHKDAVSSSFTAFVPESQPVTLYPLTVSDILYIRMPSEFRGKMNVKLYEYSSGALALNEDIVVRSKQPAEVNVSGIAAGKYNAIVSYNGKERKETIVKK